MQNHVFSLGHAKLEMPVRHPCSDVDLAAGMAMDLEVRGEIAARGRNWRVVRFQMAFKAMRLKAIIQETNVDKEK